MPQAEFKDYLEKRLHHEIAYQNKKGQKLSEEEDRERNDFHRMKNHWLNEVVFPSMANLTVFFEYVAKHEELQQVFDKDIEELLFGKNRNNQTVFQRFIRSIITWNFNIKPGNKIRDNDFRLALIDYLAYILLQQITSIGLYLIDPEITNSVVRKDLLRVLAWTKFLARNVKINVSDSRPVLF
jgi:hypothetical protein